jgi:hypothetical protein
MTRNVVKHWLAAIQHLSDKDLVLYLDGESTQQQRRRVERHLQSCWSCRAHLDEMSNAIAGLVQLRDAYFAASPPPGEWAGFDARLRRASARQATRPDSKRAPVLRFSSMKYAGLAASVLVALLCFHLWFVAPVSASEVLKQAESAELLRIRATSDPVIYQRLEVRRRIPGQSGESAMLESWLDFNESRSRQNGGAELWEELAAIYESNHMSGRRPLSVQAFSSWRNSLRDASERVDRSRLADGSEAVEIRTTPKSAEGSSAILEAGLVVRKKDWHPVSQTLRVQSGPAVREYEVVEVAYEVTRRGNLDPAIFTLPPTPSMLSTKAPVPPPEVVRPSERREPDDEIEVRALFAIHSVGACRGEPVKVGRDASGGVIVSGLVETSQRKQALLNALKDLHVKVDVVTAEEAASRDVPAAPAQRTGPGSEVRVEPEEPPLLPYLRQRMGDSEITELSDRVFTFSESSMADAWALRHLAESFPERKLEALRPPARALIEQMVRDHAAAIANNAGSYLAVLKPALPDAAGRTAARQTDVSAWPGEIERIFDLARRSQRLTQGLFLGSSQLDQAADLALNQLLACISELQVRAHSLESASLRGNGESRAKLGPAKNR